MFVLAWAVVSAALFSGGSAQAAVEHVWSAVAYLNHGEHTPAMGPDSPSLTPLGAQQMFSQGSVFRARYLKNGTDAAMVENIEAEAIDNTQLSILTTSDQYSSAGALAFTQALYPPTTEVFSQNAGGTDAATLANGSSINYPLDGYQYPDLRTLSVLDPNSAWIEGHVACARYDQSHWKLLTHDPMANQAYDQSLGFYRKLWQKVFSDAFPIDAANFYYADDLYAYASYQYNHNNNTRSEITEADLSTLADLASIQQRYLNGNLGASEPTQTDVARTIAGRMLAGKVMSQFKLNIASSGSENKLNLMFGSVEPFVAFFAISRLVDGPSGYTFQPLPGPGAAMAFELFSVAGNSTEYPSEDRLWVRFVYRNESLGDTPFVEYPLFGNGNSQSRMRFADFATAMEGVAVNGLAQWCNVCDSTTSFCMSLDENSSDGLTPSSGGKQNKKKIAPAVAGVIGALVTLAVVGLVVAAAMLIGRVRFYRAERSGGLGGGFKGAEKRKSDADVAYAGNGAQHERTGSWQLREGRDAAEAPIATPVGAVVKTTDRANLGVQQRDDDDDISLMGHTPTRVRESF